MKSSKHPILAGIAVAITLVATVLVIDQVQRTGRANALQGFLNTLSMPLLEQGDPTALFDNMVEGAEINSPDMSFINRYLPLIELEPWLGEVQGNSLLDTQQPNAEVSSKAHYAAGSAALNAVVVFSGGQWRIRQYEVIVGPAAQ